MQLSSAASESSATGPRRTTTLAGFLLGIVSIAIGGGIVAVALVLHLVLSERGLRPDNGS